MRVLSQLCASRLPRDMELIGFICTSPAQVSGVEHDPRSLRCSGGEEYHLRREAEDHRVSSKSPGSVGTSSKAIIAHTFCAHAVLWMCQPVPGRA